MRWAVISTCDSSSVTGPPAPELTPSVVPTSWPRWTSLIVQSVSPGWIRRPGRLLPTDPLQVTVVAGLVAMTVVKAKPPAWTRTVNAAGSTAEMFAKLTVFSVDARVTVLDGMLVPDSVTVAPLAGTLTPLAEIRVSFSCPDLLSARSGGVQVVPGSQLKG